MMAAVQGRTIVARQRALLRWYARHGRHTLPWRHHITPYRVLVSEIMLQQTQVERVIPYFTAWMKRWSSVEALAHAKRSDVIRAWAGLGYNRRAVHVHAAAQMIHRDDFLHRFFALSHESARGVTRNVDGKAMRVELEQLPGIGAYTANAILAFAWNLSAPCVDVNVRRVLAYAIYKRPAMMHMPLAEVERLAARVIPPGQGRAWNSALMDYGALMLRAYDVPQHNRPKPTQGRFENSSRYWRGRIVAVLRGDAASEWSASYKNARSYNSVGRGSMDTKRDGRPNVRTRPHIMVTSSQLHRALTAHGTPPPLVPLLDVLARDGVITKRGARYTLAAG